MDREVFEALVTQAVTSPWLRPVLALLAANVLTGVAAALYRGVFNLGDLADWLRSRAVPYLLGGLSVRLAVGLAGEQVGLDPGLGDVVWGFVLLALVGHIGGNLRELGIPLPAVLGAPQSSATSPPEPPQVPPYPVEAAPRRARRRP